MGTYMYKSMYVCVYVCVHTRHGGQVLGVVEVRALQWISLGAALRGKPTTVCETTTHHHLLTHCRTWGIVVFTLTLNSSHFSVTISSIGLLSWKVMNVCSSS